MYYIVQTHNNSLEFPIFFLKFLWLGIVCLLTWAKILLLQKYFILVFCYQNCSDPLWEKNVLAIKKNFWNSRLKAENLQKQTVKGKNNFWWQNAFLTCSWKFLISNKLEQVELEKLLGFRNMQVRKYFFFLWFFTELQCSVQFKPCTHHRHKSNNNGFKVIINSYCFNEISF